MFIPERQREALMRLTMCARDECMMCAYQPKDARCKDIATTAMHILANALRADEADAPQPDMAEDIVKSYGVKAESYRQAKAKTEPQTDCGWK